MGTEDDEVPLARSCDEGDEAETPGGSAVNFVPENIVSMVTTAVYQEIAIRVKCRPEVNWGYCMRH